jgi:hypothetical protein
MLQAYLEASTSHLEIGDSSRHGRCRVLGGGVTGRGWGVKDDIDSKQCKTHENEQKQAVALTLL